MSEILYPFGDMDPYEYETNRDYSIAPTELLIGESYTLMFRGIIVSGHQYYSRYPVQVTDVKIVEGGAEVELVHREIRYENWPKDPQAVFMNEQGLIPMRGEESSDTEFYDHGYLLECDQSSAG